MAFQKIENEEGLRKLKESVRTGSFAPLYFFHGEERYLQEYYLQLMKKKLVTGPMEDFNFRRFPMGAATADGVREAIESVPMMADATLVQIDDVNPLAQSASERKLWEQLLEDIPDYCYVVFYFDTVPFSKRPKNEKETDGEKNAEKDHLAETVKKVGIEVEFFKQSESELAEWISRHFKAAGKLISSELCRYLIFLTDGTMTALSAEIEKISAYSGADTIVQSDIDAVVVPTLSAVMFDITDALAAKQYDTALRKLSDVLAGQEEPLAVLGAVGSQFRRILLAKQITAGGGSVGELTALLGKGKEGYARRLISLAGRFSESCLKTALELCFETDCRLKRSFDDAPILMQELILHLAQEGRQ